jgi:hypothetical protein
MKQVRIRLSLLGLLVVSVLMLAGCSKSANTDPQAKNPEQVRKNKQDN